MMTITSSVRPPVAPSKARSTFLGRQVCALVAVHVPDMEDPIQPQQYLTAKEVARLVQVPISWIEEQTRRGLIPHIKLGRYRRYRRDQIVRWLESLA